MSWTAFLLLPCSTEQGRGRLVGDVAKGFEAKQNRKGGALVYFLLYDMVVFLICGGLLAYVFTTVDEYDHWVMNHSIFAIQTLYGFSSLPFFIFTLPGLQLVLTHAYPTAYDRMGRIRRPDKSKALQDRRGKELEQETGKSGMSLVSEADVNAVVESMASMLPSGMKDTVFGSSSKNDEPKDA